MQYELGNSGIVREVLGRRRRIPWTAILHYELKGDGVLLLPDIVARLCCPSAGSTSTGGVRKKGITTCTTRGLRAGVGAAIMRRCSGLNSTQVPRANVDLLLRWLALLVAAVAHGQDGGPKPILVLDAGGHVVEAGQVLFTRDGQGLISVSHDKSIRRWDCESGDCLRTLRLPIGSGLEGELNHAALAPDGTKLAVVGWGWRNAAGQMYFPVFLIDLIRNRVERVFAGHTATLWNVA